MPKWPTPSAPTCSPQPQRPCAVLGSLPCRAPRNAAGRGIRVIIAGAGGAAHLPGVVAALTPMPVIGVPIKASISIDGWDSMLSILQMPPGIPVATVGLDGARNAGILAAQIISTSDPEVFEKMEQFKKNLASKIVKANEEMKEVKFRYKTN